MSTEKQVNAFPSECTTLIVGRKMTADGSMIVARSEDWNAMYAKNLEMYVDTDNGPESFIARDSSFRCDLPIRLYRHAYIRSARALGQCRFQYGRRRNECYGEYFQ